jgi:elongation factor P
VSVVLASEIRKGTKILFKEQPYLVVDTTWTKPGKGGAFIRTKMKNMMTGLMHEETFRAEEKLPTPDLQYRDMQFLYKEDNLYNFMDQESYEQVTLNADQLEDVADYLKEETVYNVLYFDGRPIAVTPPLFMELAVVETQPGVRGDTAQGGATKPAKLETGMMINVPLFINEGDLLKVDTRDGKYIERVKK